jgi:hypothetical protein
MTRASRFGLSALVCTALYFLALSEYASDYVTEGPVRYVVSMVRISL